MFQGIKRAVMFCAHTDDEFIAAGTLHRLARQGVEVGIVAFSPAATEHDRTGTTRSSAIVRPEWDRSLKIIGASREPGISGFADMTPSARLHERRQGICQWVYDHVGHMKPDLAFVLSPEDENTAHAVVGEECERVMRGRVSCVLRCQFPWNYSIGRRSLHVILSPEDLEAKRQVMECYQSQKFRYDYTQMLMAQTVVDGLSVKVPHAETFEVVRMVV